MFGFCTFPKKKFGLYQASSVGRYLNLDFRDGRSVEGGVLTSLPSNMKKKIVRVTAIL